MKKLLFIFVALLITAQTQAQVAKKVLVEDFTGHWCCWCPLGTSATQHMDSLFGSNVITIGMHDYDSLSNLYSDDIDTVNFVGYPVMMVDRARYQNHLIQMAFDPWGHDADSSVYARLSTTSPVGVSISRTYNSSTRLLSVNVTANFLGAASGDLRMNCVLVEDSIQTDNVQRNCMDGNPSFPSWFGLGDPIYTYYNRNTARKSLSASWGDAGTIPASVPAGTSYSKSYNYSVPGWWNINQLKIVAFVSKYGSSASTSHGIDTTKIEILNANSSMVLSTTGISEFDENIAVENCYPNPSSGLITIPVETSGETLLSVSIFDIVGNQIGVVCNAEQVKPGKHLYHWKAGSDIANGVYVCRISTEKSVLNRRFLIAR